RPVACHSDICQIPLRAHEKLFDNYDLCRMLHVSKRTLQRYRSKCGLKYRMLNQKAFYKESDVQQFIRDNFVLFARRREDQRP
ncbi:helix-turn-helix domain-containing protein, partial [Alistipes putredinis]|uniref:helix-turn-helix domain-containing protein n=1 Tax=Alistipes putredinis TaxID=28117 RepID=UPI0024324B63